MYTHISVVISITIIIMFIIIKLTPDLARRLSAGGKPLSNQVIVVWYALIQIQSPDEKND